MKIHKCARCESCGYVTGGFRWEIPWTHWAQNPSDPQYEDGVLEAHACPDCFGTGALIELEAAPRHDLPIRMRRETTYAQHVEVVLRSQNMQRAD